MATTQEKLARSLSILKAIQDRGVRAIQVSQHKELTRVHRERLQKAGFLKPVIPGWYLQSRPDEKEGDTTSWYASMEAFVAAYAEARFGRDWQLNAEQSLLQHSGETSLAKQIQVHAPRANNDVVQLPHGCSLLLYRIGRTSLSSDARSNSNGLRLIPLEDCLFRIGPSFYERHQEAAQIALRRADVNELARFVLKDGSTHDRWPIRRRTPSSWPGRRRKTRAVGDGSRRSSGACHQSIRRALAGPCGRPNGVSVRSAHQTHVD